MSTYSSIGTTVGLSLQEAVARELIHERVAVRAAHFLRSLAERLDPAAADRTAPAGVPATAVAPHAGSPRPWSAQPRPAQPRPAGRRAPHRHS